VARVSGNHRETPTPGNRLKEVRGIQVQVIPRVIQMPVNPPEAVQVSNDPQAGHRAVLMHEVREATADDVNRPYIWQVSG
jgi:hypothetical protein